MNAVLAQTRDQGRPQRDRATGTSLPRPRLLDAMNGALDTPISIISAPHGWGKTTLISDWVRTLDANVVRTSWIDARRRGSLSEFVSSTLSGFVVDPDADVILIVDDLSGDDVDHGIDSVLAVFPHWFHLVLATVDDPSLNFARAELAASVRLDAGDLRFRIDEIERLFRFTYGRALSPADAEILSGDCAGWAAALSLFNRESRHDSDAIRVARLRTHDGSPYRDYLDSQVAVRLDARAIDLLRQCTSFRAMTAQRCMGVTGMADAAALLAHAHRVGVLERDTAVGAYTMAPLVRRHLAAGLTDTEHRRVLARAATALEREGSVSVSVGACAEARNWAEILRLLNTYGAEAVSPGSCEWAQFAPPSLAGDPAFRVAAARYRADDGQWAAARAILDRSDVADEATPIALAAATIRRELDDLTLLADRSPISPGAQPLGGALVELVRGNLSAAIPGLQRCAVLPEADLRTRLIAQLALVAIEPQPESPHTIGILSDVYRCAESARLPAIARIAHATLALLAEPTHAVRTRQSIVEAADARGDDWGAVAVLSIAALIMLRRGETDDALLDDLVRRLRQLGATALEAWARSAKAMVATVAGREGYADEAASALALAQRSSCPGALAVAYGALSLDPQRSAVQSDELAKLARQTARDSGMLGRPWTWFATPPRVERGTTDVAIRVIQRSGVVVRCFGGFALTLDGRRLDLGEVRPQAQTVLRMLALHSGNPVHRDLMASVLWGDLGNTSALHSLHVSISSLRSVLGRAHNSDEQLLLRRGEAYFLNTDASSDLISFDRAMGEASAARDSKDAEATAAALRRSVELYAGDVLPEDGAAEWVVGARERYRLRAAEAASSLAQLELMLGNSEAAVVAGERSIEIDPWRDESWRTIIDVHYRAGDPVAAARAKKNYARLTASLELPV